ncbi:MAG: D-alanine--D-alanine ligase family protein [Propionicimonas sp.]|nr:D-alanine--D-alanine ligase family protein [Propionicimonas sp.]
MSQTSHRPRVALVFGGASSEHEISCLTAGGVARVLDSARFEVVGIGITRTGEWVRVPLEVVAGYRIEDGRLPQVGEDLPPAVLLRGGHGGQVAVRDGDRLREIIDIDIAFALLHGPFGEDGTIQGLFEMLGVTYVGAGVAASAIGMDKDLMKRAMWAAGLPVGRWIAFGSRDWERDPDRWTAAVAGLGYPAFVKPARGGSSIGISRVERPEDLAAAIDLARSHDPKVVVEAGFVGCREIEVAVLQGHGGGAPRVSLPGEIVLHAEGRFYDFESKYLDTDEISLDAPARLTPAELADARDLAGRTFEAMGVEGLARVDLFLNPAGKFFVNELNTMPGFTATSMFPLLWQASGLEYPDLVADLIDLGLAKGLGLR